jgi:hypothetical protein
MSSMSTSTSRAYGVGHQMYAKRVEPNEENGKDAKAGETECKYPAWLTFILEQHKDRKRIAELEIQGMTRND